MPLFTSEYVFSDDYPTIEPSLKLDFANARALDPRITFTRDSVATYVGRDGLIKTAGVNEPRFDHDLATGESLGLLIEESRTNNITQSNASNWSNTNVTRGTNTSQDVSPEGLNTATIISETTGSGLHRIKSPNISFSDTRTFSVWIKRNSGTRGLYINANAIMGAGLNFDFDTETLGSTTGTVSFERYPNQWYRFILTGNGTGVTNGVYIQFTQSGDEGDSYYVGDTSNKFLVWGAQLEVGSFVTSHIPTSGATASRAHERAQILGASLTSFLRQGEGSVICSGVVNGLTTSSFYQSWWTLDRNNTSDRIWLYARGGGNRNQFIGGDGSTQFAISSTSDTVVGQKYKLACAYKENDVVFYEDGTQVGTDGTVDIPTVTHFGIGSRNETQLALNGTISNLSYYPKRLTNAQLQTLTQ